MKKKLAVLALAFTLTLSTLPGCASAAAWWQNFQSNPVAQTQAFEQSVQVVLGIAQATWNTIAAALPSSALATAQATFNKAVLAVNAALNALTDAVQVAVQAQNPTPDFSALMQSVSDAVTQVTVIIVQFTSTSSTGAPAVGAPPEAMRALNAAVLTMHHIGRVK